LFFNFLFGNKITNLEFFLLIQKLIYNNTNTAVESITPYQTPSPKKSQTPTTTYSTIYNYDYNNTQQESAVINNSQMPTPTMDDNPNNPNTNELLSNDILSKNNPTNLNEELMLFATDGSQTSALNNKPFYMVQEFLERAKVYINKFVLT